MPARYRSGVANEIVHLDRGDACGGESVVDIRREAAVDREAAERMIPYERLRTVLQVDQDEHQHAHELDVDIETLRCRVLHTLTDAQRADLARLLSDPGASVA